jgi:hypothetical protein
MGYFSELDIEIQDQELEFDWQAEQRHDEEEMAKEREDAIRFMSDPWNEFGNHDEYSQTEPAALDANELANIESQAEIQEYRTQGYM